MTPFAEADITSTYQDHVKKLIVAGIPEKDAKILADRINTPNTRVFKNDTYTVFVNQCADHGFDQDWVVWELSIKRNDKEPIHDWRHLQRIKNELCGAEVEAFELYPAESRLVDTANQYYVYAIMAPAGFKFPVGFAARMVCGPEEAAKVGAKQRPFEEASC